MSRLLMVALLATVFLGTSTDSFAQLDMLFAPFDCRKHAELFHEPAVEEQIVSIDSSLIEREISTDPVADASDAWRQWSVVENFTFGKDRGQLTMIADLNALHPFFRDRIRQLIVDCKKKGIALAIVETYRTHAKQNEYKTMGRKYTNSGGGKSKHQYGLAVDVVPMINGVAVWDNILLWKKVGMAGEKLGLRWGGRWRKPYDPGHFEWTGGLTSMHLSAGQQPIIPSEKYPCIQEDLELLKQFWSKWEMTQEEALSRRMATSVSVN